MTRQVLHGFGALTLLGASVLASAQAPDCEGPASDAVPDTPEWFARDADNMACAEQRHADAVQHPLLATPIGTPVEERGRFVDDPYREPSRHSGVRFRFDEATVTTPDGQVLAVEIYRPCDATGCVDLPAGLNRFEPPYPAIVSVHGGASRKELHWWSSQPLAESGYLVVSFDDATTGTTPTDVQVHAILDWLFATPGSPSAAGEHNPYWQELNRGRVGIAGHSAGGVLASRIGQEDPRISAIVSWDRAQSGTMPEDLVLRAPAMFQFSDYNCQQVPVCQPEPYASPPNPDGPGNKGEDFQRLRDAGIDTMQVAIRAATHLDWTPPLLAGSRYGELVSAYFTLAWFDRYLRGADDTAVASRAFQRLTGSGFDDSADIHNLSQGFFDPVQAALSGDPYAGNVPYALAGMPLADRLSFYYRSKCFLTVPGAGSRVAGDDVRSQGCSVSAAGEAPVTGGGGGSPGIWLVLALLGVVARRMPGLTTASGPRPR